MSRCTRFNRCKHDGYSKWKSYDSYIHFLHRKTIRLCLAIVTIDAQAETMMFAVWQQIELQTLPILPDDWWQYFPHYLPVSQGTLLVPLLQTIGRVFPQYISIPFPPCERSWVNLIRGQ